MSVRVLPRVVTRPGVIRPVALGLAGAACCLGVTGCAQFDKSLGQQQALVSFKSGTSVPERLHVRTACAKLPHVTAAPIASGVPQLLDFGGTNERAWEVGLACGGKLKVFVEKLS